MRPQCEWRKKWPYFILRQVCVFHTCYDDDRVASDDGLAQVCICVFVIIFKCEDVVVFEQTMLCAARGKFVRQARCKYEFIQTKPNQYWPLSCALFVLHNSQRREIHIHMCCEYENRWPALRVRLIASICLKTEISSFIFPFDRLFIKCAIEFVRNIKS